MKANIIKRVLKKALLLSVGVLLSISSIAQDYEYPFQDPELALEERVEDLISRLTPEEKAAQAEMFFTPLLQLEYY